MVNFSQKAQQTLATAHGLSRRLNHPHVSSAHLLLACIELGQGVAASILINAGLAPDRVRQHLEAIGGTNEPISSGYGDSTKRVLALSARQAVKLNHPEVEPEHVVLGILDEASIGGPAEDATQVLAHFGIDVAATRKLILERISGETSGQ